MIAESVVIGANVVIGEDVRIMHGVYIHDNVVIGDGATIYPYASIGTEAEMPRERHGVEGKLTIIGAETVIREFVTVNAPTIEETTTVGPSCYLMAKSHVGHDSQLGERVTLGAGATLSGHTTIRDFSFIGVNSGTHQFAKIGRCCMVGALCLFKGESPDGLTWVGVPGRPIKVNQIGIDRADLSDEEKRAMVAGAESFLQQSRL